MVVRGKEASITFVLDGKKHVIDSSAPRRAIPKDGYSGSIKVELSDESRAEVRRFFGWMDSLRRS